MSSKHPELDRMQAAYKEAVDVWIAVIRKEEALASTNHSVAQVDRWEQAHFDEEERARLFESIEERAPERSAECGRLREEHRSLLSRMDALRGVLPEERRRRSWGGDVQLLLADLLTHEDREAELLRALDEGPAAEG